MKRLAAAILLLALASPAHAQLSSGVVAHWDLDDNAPSTAIVATVNNNGVFEGGDNTDAHDVAGPSSAIPGGLDFLGTDDAVDISGSSLSFASGSAFTFSIWVDFDASSAVWGQTGASTGRIAATTDTNIAVVGTATTRNFTVASLGTSSYRHIVVTRSAANSVNVYVNATVSSSGAQALAETFAPNRIGRAVGFLDAKAAAATVWNRELSADEVTSLFNAGTGRAYPFGTVEALTRTIPGASRDPITKTIPGL